MKNYSDSSADQTSNGLKVSSIIGTASEEEGLSAGKMAWPHGFHVRHVALDPGTSSSTHVRDEEEVIFVHAGRLTVHFDEGDVPMEVGDVFTIPVGMPRTFSNKNADLAEVYSVHGGDSPKPPRIID